MDDINKNSELNSELNFVFKYLIKLGVSKSDAEDLVQETAYKYLLYYDSIKTSKIRSWLIRVALNDYYDQCRMQKRFQLNFNEIFLEADEVENPENIFLEKERNEGLSIALSRLKPYFKELLLLKYQSGLSYEEISTLLDKSVNSIKTNLFRARKKLEKIYKEANYER
ncbi:sigma-70 family RNA polymerase sigma factor [Gottfriedia sp. NPDC056225]|uniref:sigma-70 family RNA polymerase sigma factor n=1 Tax=Gottfriedia sp. NPDC056225 TaxID=3345751 RepID=UPI0035D8175D